MQGAIMVKKMKDGYRARFWLTLAVLEPLSSEHTRRKLEVEVGLAHPTIRVFGMDLLSKIYPSADVFMGLTRPASKSITAPRVIGA